MKAKFVNFKKGNLEDSMQIGIRAKIRAFFKKLRITEQNFSYDDIENIQHDQINSMYTIDENNHVILIGNIDLEFAEDEVIIPDNLVVTGSVWLMNANINSLPNGLRIRRNLDLYNTDIRSLPDDLQVRGTVDLRMTAIKEISNDIRSNIGGAVLF